nr:hypothetical protein [Trichothermofontia sichuanensis]
MIHEYFQVNLFIVWQTIQVERLLGGGRSEE